MQKYSQNKYTAYKDGDKLVTTYSQQELSDSLGMPINFIKVTTLIINKGYEILDFRPDGGIEVYDCNSGDLIYSGETVKEISRKINISDTIIYPYLKFKNKGYEINVEPIKYDYIMYKGDDVCFVTDSLKELSDKTNISQETIKRYISLTSNNENNEISIYRYIREDD